MIAVVGDFDARNATHRATTAALEALVGAGSFEWVDTDAVSSEHVRNVLGFRDADHAETWAAA